jgi:hypothetical protein
MPKQQYPHKSFYMTPEDKKMLDCLSKAYGMNPSAVIRKLVTEAYAIYKHEEKKK